MFQDKLVLITGGSKGLGLALAYEFGREGARVLIVARHEDEVAEAIDRLRMAGISIDGAVCDVSSQEQVERTIDAFQARHGQIDVLVNNAGTIHIGPADVTTIDDLRSAVDTMLWGVIYPTMKLLPAMRARDEGRIVNITSLAGKVSVPHMLPYNTAKFAATGFSEGLQAELGATGVRVVTVLPGVLRTGTYLNAIYHGETRKEFRWFSLLSSAPVLSISAEAAARRIVRATARGEPELILTLPANFIARVKGVFPGMSQHLLTLSQRFLPSSTGQAGSRTGSDIRRTMHGRLFDRALTLGSRAVARLQPRRNIEHAYGAEAEERKPG